VLGKLAMPCGTQSDFETRLSALADVINSLEVADEDLSAEHRDHRARFWTITIIPSISS
jgi:hypothetical protein